MNSKALTSMLGLFILFSLIALAGEQLNYANSVEQAAVEEMERQHHRLIHFEVKSNISRRVKETIQANIRAGTIKTETLHHNIAQNLGLFFKTYILKKEGLKQVYIKGRENSFPKSFTETFNVTIIHTKIGFWVRVSFNTQDQICWKTKTVKQTQDFCIPENYVVTWLG